MRDDRRQVLLLAALIALFVLGLVLAMGSLLAWAAPDALAAMVAAGVAAALAATVTCLVVRAARDDGAEPWIEDPSPEPPEPGPIQVRIAALPVADLPGPYVAAVVKGLRSGRPASG